MIDEYWTWIFYGYHSDELKPQSNKPIVVRCDGCCQYRVSTNNAYRDLCGSCVQKGDKHWAHGLFGKDHPNFGKRRTEEEKRKRSKANSGENNPFFGMQHTEESKRMMSESNTNPSEVIRKNIRDNHADFSGENNPFYGRHHTDKSKLKMAISHTGINGGINNPMYGIHLCGEKHWNWKGGITSWRKILYSSAAYKNWRNAVFERDDYTCRVCGERGGNVESHHILPVRDNKNTLLIFDINNGITLCKRCHRETYGKEYEFVEQFEDIIRGKQL